MIYEFMDDSGRVLEQYFPPGTPAPKIGEVVEVSDPDAPSGDTSGGGGGGGATVPATRIISLPQTRGDTWKPYVSERLPRNLEGVPCTPSGKPIISSRQQERNICAKFNFERE